MYTFDLYSYNNSQVVLMGGCPGSSSSSSKRKQSYNFGDEVGLNMLTSSHCEKV
jgi:hypothetical protein